LFARSTELRAHWRSIRITGVHCHINFGKEEIMQTSVDDGLAIIGEQAV
jgi:hypothetical protein